ncbi:hypothetical protein [Mesonia aquimarina]|uniref:hypothetical protein n=1 Tax=Mesonia aquimarina TaxID=1504967 RepID=UPI000EF5E2D8|nr:hypothetical protein [Mesonia aquimarina]
MSNAEKFLETYKELADESFKKFGYYYPPKTWKEFDAHNYNFYKNFLKDKEDEIKRTKGFIRLAKTINDFGFYNLYQNFDFKNLNDVLFQTSRQKLLNRSILASGTDHCNVLFDAFSSFSCNDFSIIDYFFPKDLPQSKGKFYTEVSVNLLKVLYYEQKQFQDEALEKANKFLSKKNIGWEKYTIQYFKALINNDAKDASNSLQGLCTSYQKMEHSVNKLNNKLEKYFAYEINGMYRFAMIVNQELFEEIKQPNHHCFSNKFEQWQKENNFPKGKVFYKYPKEMEFINAIYETELPTVELYNPYPERKKIKLFRNVEKFIEDLIENANKKI